MDKFSLRVLIMLLFAVVALLQSTRSVAQSCDLLDAVYVSIDGSDAECCGSSAAPCATLATAVTRVASSGSILLLPGRHSTNGNIVSLGGRSFTVSATSASSAATVLDCALGGCLEAVCSESLAVCSRTVVTLDGFTVQRGENSTGGCLYVEGQGLKLVNMTLSSCKAAENGGAVALINSFANFQSSTITSSSASSAVGGGGGIYLSSSRLTTTSLSVIGCSAPLGSGGGILAESASTLSLNAQSLIQGCTAAVNGGGLLTNTSDTSVTLSEMSKNTAGNGGCWYDLGGTLTVTVGTFSECTATSDDFTVSTAGGGIYGFFSISAVIANSEFSKSTAPSGVGGGAYFFTVPSVTINECNFSSNGGSLSGGGLNLDSCTATVTDSLFEGNYWLLPFGQGGGIFAQNSNLTVTGNNRFLSNGIRELDFASNQAGGGLYFYIFSNTGVTTEALLVDGALFQGNQAQTGGGMYTLAVSATGQAVEGLSAVLQNSRFVENGATFSAGALIAGSGLDVVDCDFVGNYASVTGGAIQAQVEGQQVNINSCTFTNNSALTGNGGAMAIPSGGTTLTSITDCGFSGNSAPLGFGGALYHGGLEANITSCQFVGNTAGIGGGALEVEGISGDNTVGATTAAVQGVFKNCTFDSNSAPLFGGGAHASSSARATFSNSSFVRNNSTQGGAIFMSDLSQLSFTGTYCSLNTAVEGGGCLIVQDSANASFFRSWIEGNEATSEGGAVKITGRARLSLNRCNVTSNKAPVGGAIWSEISGVLSVAKSYFLTNKAEFQGGAIYQIHKSKSVITGSSFMENVAPAGSALSADTYSEIDATSTVWESNFGTSIYLRGSSKADLQACRFTANSASSNTNGGAVSVSDNATLTANLCKFVDNSGALGGALYFESQSTGSLTLCKFEENSAQQGGALYATGSLDLTLSGSQFSTNQAQTSGGAVSLIGSLSGSLSNCTFTANQAGTDGAAVYLRRSAPETGISTPLDLSTLVFNSSLASKSQGAAFFDASYDTQLRVTCANCTAVTPQDTFGTVPTFFRYVWPGQEDKASNQTFRVLASSGDPITALQILVLDGYGRAMAADDTSVALVTPTPRISGLLSGAAQDGVVTIPSIAVTVTETNLQDLNLTVTVSSPSDAFPPIVRTLQVGFCQPGAYYNSRAFSCQKCPVGQWCAGGQPTAVCPDGSFSFLSGASSPLNCSLCAPGLSCSQGNGTVQQGYWLDYSSITQRTAVYSCESSRGCSGFQYLGEEAVQQCKPGYEARVCGACTGGYYGFLTSCNQCSNGYKSAFAVVVVVVVALWLALNWLTAQSPGADILVVEMQFLAVIGAFNLDYFAGTWISSLFQIFNVTLFYPDFLGPECMNGSYTFTQRWVFTALLPWAGIAFYLVLYLLDDLRNVLADLAPSALSWLAPQQGPYERRWSLIRSIVNLLDLLYVSVLIRCLQVFHWQQYDEKVLSVDPTIPWLSDTHVKILPFAIVYTAVYAIGVPLLFSWTLFLGKSQGLLHERGFLEKYGTLYERYEPHLFWWYIPMTWGRRMAYAAVFVFWSGHPDMQAYITFLLLLTLGLTSYFFRPHKATALDILAGALLLAQYLYLLAGTANTYMSTYVSGEPSEGVAGAALVLFLLAAAFIVLLEAQEIWARFWVRQWALTNGDEDGIAGTRTKRERLPLLDFSGLLTKKKVSSSQSPPGRGSGELPLGDVSLVPLEEITDWFNPHATSAFLRGASLSDLNLLQMIRVTYSWHAPTQDEIRQAGNILDCLPKSLRYAFINELLVDEYMEMMEPGVGEAGGGSPESAFSSSTISMLLPSSSASGTSSYVGASKSGLGSGSQWRTNTNSNVTGGSAVSSASSTSSSIEKAQNAAVSANATASIQKVHGTRRIKELQLLTEAAAGDKRRAGETLRLLLNPRRVETVTAWLLYDELEGRRALKDLLTKFQEWLLLMGTAENLETMGEWEIKARRKWRRFRLSLSL